MGVIRKSTATVILVLIAVACESLSDVSPTASIETVFTSGKTVTIASDSEWQIPSGFSIVLPPTLNRVDPMESKYLGGPPDIPDFSMTGESEASGERESVLIVVWADGVSANADPREVLISWSEEGIRRAEYHAVVLKDWNELQSATWRGQAQSLGQESPQGIIAAVISHPESQRIWRLLCFVTSEEVSDEIARICDEVQAYFRPLDHSERSAAE